MPSGLMLCHTTLGGNFRLILRITEGCYGCNMYKLHMCSYELAHHMVKAFHLPKCGWHLTMQKVIIGTAQLLPGGLRYHTNSFQQLV